MTPEAERQHRAEMIAKLFALYGEKNAPRAKLYYEATLCVPHYWLRKGLNVLVKSRVYPSIPAVGDIVESAKFCAGMHRQQYDAGHYIEAPDQWPVPGTRHGAHAGEIEIVGADVAKLAGGLVTHTREIAAEASE